MKPVVDKDPHLNYEINSVFKKVLNVFLIPYLNMLNIVINVNNAAKK